MRDLKDVCRVPKRYKWRMGMTTKEAENGGEWSRERERGDRRNLANSSVNWGHHTPWWRWEKHGPMSLNSEALHVGVTSATHIKPQCPGHPAVFSTNSPLFTCPPATLLYSSFSMSSTGGRRTVMPLLTWTAGSGKVAGPRPFPTPSSPFSTSDNWPHPWQLMVELMFSKCCNIKVNPIKKGVLMIIKHIQKRNSLTELLLGRRCAKFNSWFGRLLCDLKWVT